MEKKKTRMKTRRSALFLFLTPVASALLIVCCGAPPFPPHGFRMRSGFVSSDFSQPCSGPSVARVLTSGIVASIQGPGGGTEENFSEHLTNNFGVDDHINGRENATWNFNFNFSSSGLPNCISAPSMSLKGFFIFPTDTGIHNLICGDCICEDCLILSKQQITGQQSCLNT